MLIDNACDILQIAPFDPSKKKKKKKVVIQDPADEVDKLAEKTESLTGLSSMLQ
jgi:translation initiation factor 2 subunit 2